MAGRNEIISVLMPDNTIQNQNAGKTHHLGLEYSLTYSPSAVWSLRFSGTVARHEYVEYSEINSNQPISYNGNRMLNAPASIINAELSWRPGFMAGFRSSLEWQHIGKYFVNSANSQSY